MTVLQQFSPPGAPWVDPQTGMLTMSASVWLRDLYLRVGGSVAPSNNDLAVTEYADAGIEETKAELAALANTAMQQPAAIPQAQDFVPDEVGALRAELAAAIARIEALEQGTSL